MEFNKNMANKLAKENNPNHIVVNILKQVREHAEKGEFECKVRSYGFGDSQLYCSEKDFPENIKYVIKKLRELKFFADVRVEEKQFVDIYLLVSWKD